ncbi:MAG TPA: hypothetical protein VGQ44_03540 [Gemmatimonadaceae bacterium]|nr:hypothetical protein [Gemmatimonadaceae bacterium]
MIRRAALLALVISGGAGRAGSQTTDSLRPSAALTGLQGIGMPTYERVSGVGLPVGLDISVPRLRFTATPLVTYRSQLGAVDPSVEGSIDFPRDLTLDYSAVRGVFTNDAWIRNDLINGFEFLAFGQDTRNYTRGTRGELRLNREWTGPGWRVKPEIGGRFEHLESLRSQIVVNSAPFTFLGGDSIGRFRPNPPVQGGGIQSALAGVHVDWDSAAIETHLKVGIELAHQSSTAVGAPVTDPLFGQLTLDGNITFPTFGRQTLHVYAHVVATSGGETPRQRWAFLGGPGTLPTIDLLSLGGDQLVYIDAHYAIPIRRWTIRGLGAPLFELREAFGGAAFQEFPELEQLSGVRLALSYLYAEWLVDPVRRTSKFSAGFSLF